jgi:2-polyprenyl-6-methoxyphenol hydroxylase-like FAD-dependent oxidoreductase
MNAQPDVLIAGAGPTGLLLALWLTRADTPVRIVDPKTGPTKETRAVVVQARTMELYDQLGIGADALSRSGHFDSLSLWSHGQLSGQVQLHYAATAITPHPDVYILTQDQNEALLNEQLRTLGVEVEWETELTGFTQDAALCLDTHEPTCEYHARFYTRRHAFRARPGCNALSSATANGLSRASTSCSNSMMFMSTALYPSFRQVARMCRP